MRPNKREYTNKRNSSGVGNSTAIANKRNSSGAKSNANIGSAGNSTASNSAPNNPNKREYSNKRNSDTTNASASTTKNTAPKSSQSPATPLMRLNKFIAHNSTHSRRQADALIASGAVKVGAKTITNDAHLVNIFDDKITINHKRIYHKKDFTTIIYHKPKAQLVTHHDERGRATVFHTLPSRFSHFRPVGRLDYASSGLLLLVDSPVIADFLMRSNLEREYLLKLRGTITSEVITAMEQGLSVRGCTKGAHAKTTITDMDFAPFIDYHISPPSGGYQKLKVLINEGKNRELRRFFGYFDLEVVELKRVAFGIMELGMLKEGKWRFFTTSEYDKLRDFLKQNQVFY